MNIIFVGGQEIPGVGGVESYMLNLAKELSNKGNNVSIICSGRKSLGTTVDNIRVIHYVCPKSNVVALPLLFFKSIGYIIKNRKEIDVVNYQSIFMAFIPGWIATISGCKACYTIHSLAEDNPKHGTFMKFMMKVVAFISIWLCGNNIITISKSKAREIKARYGRKCAVIPCGIAASKDCIETDILDHFGIKKGEYYLSIGRIDPVKNLDTLIKSFNNHCNPNKQLVIAGNYEDEYGAFLKGLTDNNPNIIFTGIVMGDDKETLLKNCYANCLVSSSEGMPISLLEAMIYAKPCIVTDIPATKEIIEEPLGYWCKVGDIETLSTQMSVIEREYETAKAKGIKLKENVESNYLWEKVAKKYIEYLNSIGVK